eukprot:COSAG02_NODE_2426_length_8891_cov_4.565059_2_plen_1149_part_00
MAQAINAESDSFNIAIQAEVTLSQDTSILSGDDAAALAAFQQSFRDDIAALLGGIGDEVEITSMAAGSIVVGFEMAIGAAHGTATIPDTSASLLGETIASSTAASVGSATVAFKISALSLADSGTDIVTALPLLNTAISEGRITGVSSELSVFSSLIMQCPAGYYTDPSGACSHCAVDENGHAQEPNAAQDGCIKCTDRVTSALMSWHSPIGAQCELCPIGRAPNEKRTACEPCVGNEYSDGQGMLCEPCGMGTQPSSDRSECVACEENYFSTVGTCDACPRGRFGVNSRGADPQAPVSSGANACEQCEVGRTGWWPGTGCPVCEVGFYSLTADGVCESCVDTLKMPDPRQIKSVVPPVLSEACWGGLPGVAAGICPMPGVWVHPSSLATGTPEILPCEADGACIFQYDCVWVSDIGIFGARNADNRSAYGDPTFLSNELPGLAPGAVCGPGNEGFLCASCKEGFTKIGGVCIECSSFDFRALAVSFLVSLGSAFFLLHKSTGTAVVSPDELRQLWSKVDHSEAPTNDRTRTGYGYLSVDKALGVRYGHFGRTPEQTERLASESFAQMGDAQREEELKEMGKSVMLLTGIRLTEQQKNDMVKQHFGGHGPISVNDFCRVRGKSQPTTGFAVAIFFVQTFALLAKDAGFFGFADALNMDSEQALGACVAPLTYHQRFFSKLIITPLIMFAGVPLSQPVWNRMRQIGCLKARFAKMNLPTSITPVHRQRGILNAFLYCFAPLTRLAIEALVCVPTCSDEESDQCPQVLAFDQGVRCFEGEHKVTGIIAIVVLFVMAIAIPILLIMRVQHARNKRNQSLTLKVNEVEKWFNSIDVDGSGELDRDEVRELLAKLGEGKSKSKFEKNWEELDQPDENGVKDGVISLDEFSDWYMKRVEAVPDTPYDVLFGAYSAGGYWWFMQVLWLKTAINMLFTFGYFGTFQWHLWVHLALATSVCLMVLSQPHTSRVDYVIELFVLLCLAAVTHVSSIFKSGEEWGTRYLVATAVLAFLPLITTFSLAFSMQRAAKSDAKEADKKRQANAEYEIRDDMSWSNEPELRERFDKLTVQDLEGIAIHFKVDRKKLEEVVETDTMREKIIALLEEQREKEEAWRKGAELEEQELSTGSTNVAAEVVTGGCFATIAQCCSGGDDED